MSEVTEEDYSDYLIFKDGQLKIKAANAASNEIRTDGIIVGDLWGYISDVNDAAVKMYGAEDKSELVGKHVLEFLIPQERARAVKESLDSIASNRGMKHEFRVRSKTGAEVRLEITTTLVRNEQGENLGFLDVIRNPQHRS